MEDTSSITVKTLQISEVYETFKKQVYKWQHFKTVKVKHNSSIHCSVWKMLLILWSWNNSLFFFHDPFFGYDKGAILFNVQKVQILLLTSRILIWACSAVIDLLSWVRKHMEHQMRIIMINCTCVCLEEHYKNLNSA